MTSPIGGLAAVTPFAAPTGSGGIAARNSVDVVDNPTGLAMGASAPALTGVTGTTASIAASTAVGGTGFAGALTSALDRLQGTQDAADSLGAQAATGDLKDVHDYIIARTEASLATEMVVAFKNKAVEAFNDIMRMPI